MYSLYIDKPTEFTCDVAVKNASTKSALARIVVESGGISLLFEGTIRDGKCNIPINRLKGLLDENSRGKIKLEIIVEDTYFIPWQDEFLTETHTGVKVKINEQKRVIKPTVRVVVKSNKPTILKETRGVNMFVPIKEIASICEQFGIKKNNLKRRKKDFTQIIKEYFKMNSKYNNHLKPILSNIDNFLQ